MEKSRTKLGDWTSEEGETYTLHKIGDRVEIWMGDIDIATVR
jgi:hypothetical protein